MGNQQFLQLLTQNDSVLSLPEISANTKDRPPDRNRNHCYCPDCGCDDHANPNDNRRKSDTDIDTASLRSDDSNFSVTGQEGIEDSFEMLNHSFHEHLPMERWRSEHDDGHHLFALFVLTNPNGEDDQVSPLTMSMDSMIAHPDSMTHSMASIPRPPSPSNGATFDGIGAMFDDFGDAFVVLPLRLTPEAHCLAVQPSRRPSRRNSGDEGN